MNDEFKQITCTVLYDFEGTNDGELSVNAGAQLVVIELDEDNSGWTNVSGELLDGYVPTSYLRIN